MDGNEIQLEKMTVAQLKTLCKYFDIEVFPEWKKADLITALKDYVPKEYESLIPGQPKRSVRVQRIYDSMKGK